jgi:hypothetical protein
VQVDNDGNGLVNEDWIDGVDNDADLAIDEDPAGNGAVWRIMNAKDPVIPGVSLAMWNRERNTNKQVN